MRVLMLSAVAAAAALLALPAAAHGWSEDREAGPVNECPLPYHHHAGHVIHHHGGHVAYHCQMAAVTPPVEEHVRIYRHEDVDEWRSEHERCGGDRCGDRDREDAGREHEEHWRGGDHDRDMYEDRGHGYADGGVHYEHYGPDMTYERRAYVDGAVHHEDEDRRGYDDHEYAYRHGGMHWDAGDGRWRVYGEERERVWARGEHWFNTCGCGPARPTATDQYGYLVWAGKVAPEGYPDEPTWEIHP